MSEPNPFRDPSSDIPQMASWTGGLHHSTGSDKSRPSLDKCRHDPRGAGAHPRASLTRPSKNVSKNDPG